MMTDRRITISYYNEHRWNGASFGTRERQKPNERKHAVSFETATEAFADSNQVTTENYLIDGEQRLQVIGMTHGLVLLLVLFVDHSDLESKSSVSFPRERWMHMKGKSTPRKVRITDEIRRAYEERDKSLDNADPDAPVLPPEMWERGEIGKYYRPRKTIISLRIDNDVLAWVKSQSDNQSARINKILRERMMADRKHRLSA